MLHTVKTISLTANRTPIFCAFLFAAVVVLLPISAQAQGGKQAENAGNAPFTGVWETVAGSATLYTVRLTQIGNKVTGTYSPRNGKIFGGEVTGNKLTFNWTQDGGYEGTAEFTLNDDGKGFTGSATASKPSPSTNSWKTYQPDPPSSFAGTWETTSAFRSIPLSISQKGAKVTGTFPTENGTIEGSVLAKILRFKWESDVGSGSGQIRISTSGNTFTGWFNKGDDPDVEGTRWEGNRITRGKAVSIEQSVEKAVEKAVEKVVEKVADPSFDGAWIVMEGGRPGAMEIKQSGAIVTGVYGTSEGSFEIKNAAVNGNTLRFSLVGRKGIAVVSNIGELVLGSGGKSFKGNINGVPVTGMFARPM